MQGGKLILHRWRQWISQYYLKRSLGAEVVLFKMARWGPDKNWDGALKATRGLKERGLKTVLVARGGVEPYGREVVRDAHTLGLRVKETLFQAWPRYDYLAALRHAAPADVLVVKSPIPLELSRLLYRAADVVLANSRHEPCGLVGLEAMAAGGVAVTGSTGEDYTIPLVNALRQIPNHFLPQELSLKVLTSLKGLESHALEKGLPVQDLQGLHRIPIEAVQRGFEQAYSLAAVLAAIGIMVGLLLPRRVAARTGGTSDSRGPGDRESQAPLDTTNAPSGQDG